MKKKLIYSLFIILVSVLSLSGMVFAKAPNIHIENSNATLSSAMVGVGSVFMNIINSGNENDVLIGARISIQDTIVEFHKTKDGKMEKIKNISIPSNSTIEFKPKGLHIMIFNMPKSIKEGYQFTLYLLFKKSGEKQVVIEFAKTDNIHLHH